MKRFITYNYLTRLWVGKRPYDGLRFMYNNIEKQLDVCGFVIDQIRLQYPFYHINGVL